MFILFVISRLRKQSQPFAILVSLETWLYDADLKDWHYLHKRVFSDFCIVLLYDDIVERGRMQGIVSCVFG